MERFLDIVVCVAFSIYIFALCWIIVGCYKDSKIADKCVEQGGYYVSVKGSKNICVKNIDVMDIK